MTDSFLEDFEDKAYFELPNGNYLSVEYDPYSENPLTSYDTLGTFLTWERQHIPPCDNPYPSAVNFMESLLGEEKASECQSMQDVLQALDKAGYAACGIYRFKHGLADYFLAQANPYSDRWDFGPVGFAFVSPEMLKAEEIDKEQAEAIMKGEMRDYAAWVNGSVYLADECDRNGELMYTYTVYGSDSFEEYFPFAKPISLDGFANLAEYAEHAALAPPKAYLDKTLDALKAEAKKRAAEKNAERNEQANNRKPPAPDMDR